MKLLRVHMPTTVYLKKYITFYEGDQPVINNKSPFRRFVFALLEKGVIRDEAYAPKWLAAEQNTELLTMLVTQRTFGHVGHTVTMEKAMYINAFLKEQFDTALTMAGISLHYRKGLAIKHALIRFCEELGIAVEVDISLDSLLKKWHRKLGEFEPKRPGKNIPELLIQPAPLSTQLSLFNVTEKNHDPASSLPQLSIFSE